MEFTGDVYAKNQEEFDEIVNSAVEQGYVYREMSDSLRSNTPSGRGIFCTLSPKVYQRKAKCNFCGHNNSAIGCKSHGKMCDNCEKTIHYDLVPGDLVTFSFIGDDSHDRITLRVKDYKYMQSVIYFEKAIPRRQYSTWGGKLSRKEVLETLEKHKDSYKIVKLRDGKEYYAFYKPLHMVNEFSTIDVYETRGPSGRCAGKTHNSIVQIYDGVEYDEYSSYHGFDDSFPVPQTFHIYRDWKVEKSLQELCSRANIVYRASYYSGRGINPHDIGPDHLVDLYNLIKEYKGDDAAQNFELVVSGTMKLTATAFIKRLKQYEVNDFKWESNWDENQVPVDNIEIEKDEHEFASTVGTLISVSRIPSRFFGYQHDTFDQMRTEEMRAEFLTRIGR